MSGEAQAPHEEPAALDGWHHGRGFKWAFHLYKAIVSPVMHAVTPARCLYLPTCSEYAYVAVRRFGIVRGGWMAFKRFARCHPLAEGGFDPVPERGLSGVASPPSGTDHLP